jgi:hypothetical protein
MERTQINEAIRVWRKADDEHRAILSLLSDGDNYSLGFGGSERTLQGALMSAMDDDLDIYVFLEKTLRLYEAVNSGVLSSVATTPEHPDFK